MKPLEFLAEVLPTAGNGYYCLAELTTNKKEHVYAQTLEELEPALERWNEKQYDIYFGLSTFGEAGSREAGNTHMSRVIAVDLDCNHKTDIPQPDKKTGELVIKPKAYPSMKAAAIALREFCDNSGLTGLGEPWLASSGGGVHAYWPLTEDMFIEDWKPLAEGFKRMCLKHGLKLDTTVTGDAARVLRLPGTTNRGVKGNKKVREATQAVLKQEGDRFSPDDLKAIIDKEIVGTAYEYKVQPKSSLALAGVAPTSVTSSAGSSSTLQALTQNSVTKFANIYKKTKQGSGCAQLVDYFNRASEDGMEPTWRGWLSIAQKCEDGEKAVIWLSDLHPYDHDRMRQKLNEIKGPYPCVKFDEENPGICAGCQHWGKITNPLALGRETAVVVAETEIEVDTGVEAEPVQRIKRPEPPKGYAYGKQGGVFLEREDMDPQGNTTKKHVMLCQYDVFPVDILNKGGVHEVHLYAVRGNKVQEVVLPQKCVASKDETIKHLANQNVMAAFGSGNDKNFYEYIRACVEKMSVEKEPVAVPNSFGWQDDGTFVYAGKIYSRGNAPLSVPMPDMENIVANTQPKGTLENWQRVIEMMVRRKMWKHLAVLLAGAAAPLMQFTGLFGITMHVASSESGTGKSFALDTAASIWGHPIHYRTGSGTSAVAMQQRLGLLHSMPLVTDEITTNNRKDFEWFPAFLFSMSEGRGKERMESGANKERLNLSTWSSYALMSSNRNAVDYLMGARLHSSEGEIRRLLELLIDDKLEWSAEEIEVIKSLQQNYGVAGQVLVQYLVDNTDYVRDVVNQTVRQMYTVYDAPNDERFWMAGIGVCVGAGILFNSKHTGLAEIPMNEIIEVFREVLTTMRLSIKGNKRSADDLLNSYIQEHQGKFVVVKYGEKGGVLATFHDGAMVGKNTTRAEVMGRVEHGVTANCVDFYIEERLLRAYCSNMSFSYNTFKTEMQDTHHVTYIQKKDMMSKTDGPPMRVAVMKISKRMNEDVTESVQQAVSLAVN